MYGIISCTSAIKYIYDENGSIILVPLDNEELNSLNNEMQDHGLIPNYEYDCYILDGYGAFMGNTIDKNLNIFYWNSFIDMGYDLVIGPKSIVDSYGNYGVFCKNYEEIYKMSVINNDEEEKENILVKISKAISKAIRKANS